VLTAIRRGDERAAIYSAKIGEKNASDQSGKIKPDASSDIQAGR